MLAAPFHDHTRPSAHLVAPPERATPCSSHRDAIQPQKRHGNRWQFEQGDGEARCQGYSAPVDPPNCEPSLDAAQPVHLPTLSAARACAMASISFASIDHLACSPQTTPASTKYSVNFSLCRPAPGYPTGPPKRRGALYGLSPSVRVEARQP